MTSNGTAGAIASPLTADEIAAVRKPYRAASLLPGRAYHDQAIHDFEREVWFRRDWMIVGREEDAPDRGTYFLAQIGDEPLVIARGRDGELRAFYNVCRHRGTAVVEEACGKAVRFQCPYHSWIYDLEGNLVRAKHTEDLEDFDRKDFGLAWNQVLETGGVMVGDRVDIEADIEAVKQVEAQVA